MRTFQLMAAGIAAKGRMPVAINSTAVTAAACTRYFGLMIITAYIQINIIRAISFKFKNKPSLKTEMVYSLSQTVRLYILVEFSRNGKNKLCIVHF